METLTRLDEGGEVSAVVCEVTVWSRICVVGRDGMVRGRAGVGTGVGEIAATVEIGDSTSKRKPVLGPVHVLERHPTPRSDEELAQSLRSDCDSGSQSPSSAKHTHPPHQ